MKRYENLMSIGEIAKTIGITRRIILNYEDKWLMAWYKPSTGNYTLHYKGENITIMKSKFGPNWGVIFQSTPQWEYNGKKIDSLDTAKIVAFDLFDALHESRHQEQPCWDGHRWIYI